MIIYRYFVQDKPEITFLYRLRTNLAAERLHWFIFVLAVCTFVLLSHCLLLSCPPAQMVCFFIWTEGLRTEDVSKCSDMKNSWQDLWFWEVWIKTDSLKAPNFVFLVLNDLAEDEAVWTCRLFNISFLIWYIFLYLDYLCQWFWFKSISACPSVMLRRR